MTEDDKCPRCKGPIWRDYYDVFNCGRCAWPGRKKRARK